MATEADVTQQIIGAPQGAIFVWRNAQGVDEARDRAAAVGRSDIEFYPPSILRDVPAFLEDRGDRPVWAVVVDATIVLTTRKQAGIDQLMAAIVPREEEGS